MVNTRKITLSALSLLVLGYLEFASVRRLSQGDFGLWVPPEGASDFP
jgi:hypothetical protein